MYTFSKCKVKHLLLSMCALPPIRYIRHKRSATRRRAPFVKYIKLNVSSSHYLVPSFSVMSVGRIDTVMQLFCLSSTLLTKS